MTARRSGPNIMSKFICRNSCLSGRTGYLGNVPWRKENRPQFPPIGPTDKMHAPSLYPNENVRSCKLVTVTEGKTIVLSVVQNCKHQGKVVNIYGNISIFTE